MTPISEKCFFHSPALEGFSQDEEKSQWSTTQKSSQVAMAALSSPTQKIEDRDLSHTSDLSDFAFSSLDFSSEDLGYCEQGSYSLEDLFVESIGYKRKGSPKESLKTKRICFSEPEDCQNVTPCSQDEAEPCEINSFMEQSGREQKSISQLDEFYQMVHTSEVLGPSKEEWMSDSLNSHEELTEQQWVCEAEAEGFQESLDLNEQENQEEIRETSTFSEPLKSVLEPKARAIIGSYLERKVVELACKIPSMTGLEMENQLREEGEKISYKTVLRILRKHDLNTPEKRKQAAKALEIQDHALQQIESSETDSLIEAPQIRRMSVFDEKKITLKERIVLNAVHKNFSLGHEKLFERLSCRPEKLSLRQIENVLIKYGLSTLTDRREAFHAGWPRFKTLPLPEIEPVQKLKRFGGDDSLRKRVLEFALKNPKLGCRKMGEKINEISEKGSAHISGDVVYRILKEKGLETPEKREEAAKSLI